MFIAIYGQYPFMGKQFMDNVHSWANEWLPFINILYILYTFMRYLSATSNWLIDFQGHLSI